MRVLPEALGPNSGLGEWFEFGFWFTSRVLGVGGTWRTLTLHLDMGPLGSDPWKHRG